MKKIIPFENANDAKTSLDNGGRFYNMLSKPDDGIITHAEVARVAGLFNAKQQTVLFFELSTSLLSQDEKDLVMASLSPDFRVIYAKYQPARFLPSEVQSKGVVGSNVMVTGIPMLIGPEKDFLGFIMVSTGKVFMMIPIIDQYDVYEIRDEISSESFLIAHAKGEQSLPAQRITVAGVLKELKKKQNEVEASRKFLEATYFMDIIK